MIRDTGIPDDDRIYSLNFYEDCCQKVVSTFKGFHDILAIYRFGQVAAPGNSDIDFVLVVKKRKNIGHLIKKTFEDKFNRTEQYIVYQHDPMILTESLMPHIHMIRSASNLTLLHGRPIRIENSSNDEMNIIQLIELVIQYSPRMFKADVPEWYRWPLQVINAYKFILEKATALGFSDPDPVVGDILNQNDNMRTNFRKVTQDHIRQFCARAFAILEDHVLKIEHWLESELIQRYASWKMGSRNYKVKNIVLKNKENKYLTALAQKRQICIHSGVFSPLFFKINNLPPPIRKEAARRSAILRSYIQFLYNECNDVGLYRPWHLPAFTTTKRLNHYLTNIFINVPFSDILADIILKSKSLSLDTK